MEKEYLGKLKGEVAGYPVELKGSISISDAEVKKAKKEKLD